MRVTKPVPIEIRCVSHSIGETEDKSPLVWLGGRGGWYEINPAESYRPMYSKMCQAISMYYAVVDVLSAPGYKRKKGTAEIDELLFQVSKYALPGLGGGVLTKQNRLLSEQETQAHWKTRDCYAQSMCPSSYTSLWRVQRTSPGARHRSARR